jgi:hypothetical protein
MLAMTFALLIAMLGLTTWFAVPQCPSLQRHCPDSGLSNSYKTQFEGYWVRRLNRWFMSKPDNCPKSTRPVAGVSQLLLPLC